MVRMSINNNKSNILVESKTIDTFKVTAGLKQEDPLSTGLYNLVLEGIIYQSRIKKSKNTRHCQGQVYADNVAAIVMAKENLKSILIEIKNLSKINQQKTEYMEIRKKKGNKNNKNLENFNYLGVKIANNKKKKIETEKTIIKGQKVSWNH